MLFYQIQVCSRVQDSSSFVTAMDHWVLLFSLWFWIRITPIVTFDNIIIIIKWFDMYIKILQILKICAEKDGQFI